MSHLRTVLFDLDGTLADTAPDLAHALNELLREERREPLSHEAIRPEVSNGSPGLLQLGFNVSPNDSDYDRLRERLLSLYAARICVDTRLFPGMASLIEQLVRRGMNWGIVTNKPAFLTKPLVHGLKLSHPPVTVISGDTTAKRKPHPEPLLLACQEAGSVPAQSLYVGDAPRDIEAGRAAGMQTLVASFGYIDSATSPESWGADGVVDSADDILRWIDARTEQRAHG